MPVTPPSAAPDLGPIRELVRRTRLLLRLSWAVTGAGLTLGVAFAALAAAAAADLLVPLVGPWVRIVGLVLVVIPTLGLFVGKCVVPLGRRLRSVEVARRIEANIPGMHSRLVSCLDLAGGEREMSAAFYRKLVDEANHRIRSYRATAAVDGRTVRQAVLTAVVGVGLFGLLSVALGDRLTTAVARVLKPFADLPPASGVVLSVEPGTTKILVGEDVTFVTYLSSKSHEESGPFILELTGEHSTIRHLLDRSADDTWRRTLRGLSAEKGFENGFTYRVFGGGTWTRQNCIDWAARPAVRGTTARLRYPDYLAMPGDRAVGRDVIGPVGSTVEIVVEADGDVAAGEVQLFESRIKNPPVPERAWFGGALAGGPATSPERDYVPAGTFPLQRTDGGTWVGTFPLTGSGRYRVVLRNELGHANRPASDDPRYEAIPDQPPVVTLDRPGADLVLSRPDKIPLQVAAGDDFGLLDLWLAVQRTGETGFTRTTRFKEYPTPNPSRADAVIAALDLTASGLSLKPGEALRYRVEVRDRRPDAVPVASKEFAVRIAADASAADQLLDRFERAQDAVRGKLAELVAEQRKIKEKIDRLKAEHDVAGPNAPRRLAGQRRDLEKLAAQEKANVAAAAQLDRDLKDLAATARRASLLNQEIGQQVQDLAERFPAAARDPLTDLEGRLQQGADPAANPPDLTDIKIRSDRVQKNLESLQGRMDAVADAHQGMKADPEKALAKLKDDLLKEHGRTTARDLAELKDLLKELREELGKWQGKQEDLAGQTDKADDAALPDLEGKQRKLDDPLHKDLDRARKLLDRERARRMEKADPADAAAPKERKAVPKDAADATPGRTKAPPGLDKKAGPEEDMFKPALKGEREKLDPKFGNKMSLPPGKGGQRDQLREHQTDNLRDLDAAQKGLKSDEQSLEKLIQSLLKASQSPTSKDGQGPARPLKDVLRSEAMKAALDMARRAKQSGQGQPPTGTAADSSPGNATGAADRFLDELDAKTRATILQLPPRVREELLQGMKAQGPEGYQKFIEEYFRRLSAGPK